MPGQLQPEALRAPRVLSQHSRWHRAASFTTSLLSHVLGFNNIEQC